jgi:hypothetical protein
LSNSTEKGDGQKKFIDILLEKKRSSGAISGVFWSRGVIYGDVLRYLVTPCLIPCEIVMHEMQIAAFMQSLPIVVGRCVGDRLELMIDRTCFHLAKSPSICTTLTSLPQCRNKPEKYMCLRHSAKEYYICATCGDFDQSEWDNRCSCEATQF